MFLVGNLWICKKLYGECQICGQGLLEVVKIKDRTQFWSYPEEIKANFVIISLSFIYFFIQEIINSLR